MAQLSFLSIALNKKKLRCEKFLDEMLKVVPWQMLVSEISPYYTNNQQSQIQTSTLSKTKEKEQTIFLRKSFGRTPFPGNQMHLELTQSQIQRVKKEP